MCKISNGIIGITRNDPARDRFCTTWAERSHITNDTKVLFGLDDDPEEEAISTHKGTLPSSVTQSENAIQKLVAQFQSFNVFRVNLKKSSRDDIDDVNEQISLHSFTPGCTNIEQDNMAQHFPAKTLQLISISSNDVATEAIKTDLLTAEERGKKLVQHNAQQRLIDQSIKFFDPLKRNNPKTFSTLHKNISNNTLKQKKTVKADRKLIQRLFNASQSGRKVDMQNILKHELSPMPLSLSKLDGEMNSTAKAEMLDILTKNIVIPAVISQPDGDTKSCVLIDGHALIHAIGKPSNCCTFNDYADVFIQIVCSKFGDYVQRVDVVFDRSIGKQQPGTRELGNQSLQSGR
jgi:hypothetical protein